MGRDAWPSPIGRRAVVDAVRSGLAAGSVLLYGPAGIGKSTVLEAAARAGTAEWRILRAAAAEAEAALPYLALVDLLGTVAAEVAGALPGQLRAALDAALLRSSTPATAQDQLAVRLAVLEVLRLLAARQPVLIVLDDVQWVDEPSAGVLSFVARRLDGVAVRVLAAERVVEGESPRRSHLCPPPCTELVLPPMATGDVAQLLREKFRDALPRAALARASAASGGNPLYAVELGRVLAQREPATLTLDLLPVPDRLRQLLAARLAELPPASGEALLVIAFAARPARTLVLRAANRLGPTLLPGLAAAETAGVIVADPAGAVRFTHPLLREMVYGDAAPAARRRVHEQLAEIVDDPMERARHLALARVEPDESLAATLLDAATVARQRGAPGAAADLAGLAADRTPVRALGRAAACRLMAATYAYAAGQPDAARAYAEAALRDGEDAATRVGARLLLVDLAEQNQSGVGPLLDAALADAGDDHRLLARVHVFRALKAYYDADLTAMVRSLDEAVAAAEACGDVERAVEAISLRGSVEVRVSGRSADELIEEASSRTEGLPLSTVVVLARQRAAIAKLLNGDVAEAIQRIEELRAVVERSGTIRDLAGVLLSATSIYCRAGRGKDALAAGRYCAQLFLDAVATPGPGLLAGALAELLAGDVERAAQLAAEGVAASQAAGDDSFLGPSYAVLGQVHLLRGDPMAAVDEFRRAHALELRLGHTDPAMMLWHGDFVEALVAVGARGEAAEVLAEARSNAKRYGRSVVELSLARAEALLIAAELKPRPAAEKLLSLLRRYAGHPYPVEEARAWHTLGIVQRRAHRKAAAREALTEAVSRYAATGAENRRWQAMEDLNRLDGTRGPGLTDTERRIVELVRSGATNREIAASVFLSVKAVEANLTRLYRRLGVRNRAQLARAVQSGPAAGRGPNSRGH